MRRGGKARRSASKRVDQRGRVGGRSRGEVRSLRWGGEWIAQRRVGRGSGRTRRGGERIAQRLVGGERALVGATTRGSERVANRRGRGRRGSGDDRRIEGIGERWSVAALARGRRRGQHCPQQQSPDGQHRDSDTAITVPAVVAPPTPRKPPIAGLSQAARRCRVPRHGGYGCHFAASCVRAEVL